MTTAPGRRNCRADNFGGGASHGNLFPLLFGLALSIPFVVFTSGLLSLLMDRYPVIVYAGAAVLGKVAAEMVLTDPVVVALAPVSTRALWVAEAITAAAVIAAGKLWLRWLALRAERRERADHEAALRILGLRLAVARVRAALFTDRHLQLPLLEVLEKDAGILVRGVVHRPEEKHLIQEAACAHAGDHPVRLDLKFR